MRWLNSWIWLIKSHFYFFIWNVPKTLLRCILALESMVYDCMHIEQQLRKKKESEYRYIFATSRGHILSGFYMCKNLARSETLVPPVRKVLRHHHLDGNLWWWFFFPLQITGQFLSWWTVHALIHKTKIVSNFSMRTHGYNYVFKSVDYLCNGFYVLNMHPLAKRGLNFKDYTRLGMH